MNNDFYLNSKKKKIKWYRCTIEREKLKKLSERSDLKGFYQAFGHITLWALTGTSVYLSFSNEYWIVFILSLFVHGTIGTFFDPPFHELSHGTVFRTKIYNEIFIRFFSLFGWLNFYIYKMSHTFHHRFTLHRDTDHEFILPRTPSLKFLYLLQLFTFNFTGGFESRGLIPTLKDFILHSFNNLEKPFSDWGSELYKGKIDEQRKAVNWARFVLFFHVSLTFLFLYINQPILIIIISGHIFIGNWLRYFVGMPMHIGLKSDVPDFRKCVRTIKINPLFEFLYWHMNWHLEHHMFAGVPCYNLKKLHKIVSDEMPKPRTLFGAWKEMRDTWKKQQINPDYEFDTPVPNKNNSQIEQKKDNDLESSFGDLVPIGLK